LRNKVVRELSACSQYSEDADKFSAPLPPEWLRRGSPRTGGTPTVGATQIASNGLRRQAHQPDQAEFANPGNIIVKRGWISGKLVLSLAQRACSKRLLLSLSNRFSVQMENRFGEKIITEKTKFEICRTRPIAILPGYGNY